MLKRSASVFIIIVVLLLALTSGLSGQTVTFVQLTDPHLYDAGNRLLPQGAREQYLDNRAALEWAILQINKLQSSGKCLDFVVITGDFGLDVPKGASPPSVDDYARPLNALQQKTILVVPGNNDLVGEKPADIGRFRRFVADLQAQMPGHTVIDVSQTSVTLNNIRLLGLNSASFKNADGKDALTNRTDQLNEMKRLEKEIIPGQPHIIFTHIPNVEDPYRGPSGNKIHEAWQVDKSVLDTWDRVVSSREVIGVFAGHFHDPRRIVYGQDYGWTSRRPNVVDARKTWIAPPLAAKLQEDADPQARGFLLVSASATGKITATISWYGFAAQSTSPVDKASNLLEGDEAARDEDWQKAAQAYDQALASTDSSVRASAIRGFQRAHEEMRSLWWRQKLLHSIRTYFEENWVEFVLKLLAVLVLVWLVIANRQRLRGLVKWWIRTRTSPIIITPAKYTTDAPVDLFAAEMKAASENLGSVLKSVVAAPLVHSRSGSGMTLYLPSQGFQEIIAGLPDVKGINLGKIAAFVMSVVRYFSWHIESGLATSSSQAVAVASLRQGWRTEMTWRVSGPISNPLDVAALSRELAYNVLGIPFVR